ncbi:MAG: hypothetical protein U5L00_05160 [Desulfovermiculus sp.]|nr:hypothetical protein [Desulfovermiculus sp.]
MYNINQINFNYFLHNALYEYDKQGTPINVDFRKLIKLKNYPDRYTHIIHPYTAKVLAHIPNAFINSFLNDQYNLVLDPFCGSGTVLLESILGQCFPIGADPNPIAQLISKVKTKYIDEALLNSELNNILKNAKTKKNHFFGGLEEVKYWFAKQKLNDLGKIFQAINDIEDQNIKNFFLLAYSSVIKKVSFADPRISVPVKMNPHKYKDGHQEKIKTLNYLRKQKHIDVYNEFYNISTKNIFRNAKLKVILNKELLMYNTPIYDDARHIDSTLYDSYNYDYYLPDNSVDMIITSPPYVGSQKYIRSSSLNLYLTKLIEKKDFASLKSNIIGRDQFKKSEYLNKILTGITEADEIIDSIYNMYPLRGYMCAKYLLELYEVFNCVSKKLKKNKYLILVISNNTIVNHNFDTCKYIKNILKNFNFKLCLELIDNINSRGLMTKRNKTASIITNEWVGIFQKKG